MMHNWSCLPQDLLQNISDRVDTIYDYVRFRAVCTSWRSALPKSPQHLPAQIPWLMLPYDPHTTHRDFYSLSESRVHRLELPEARGKYCFGSSQGWLIFVDDTRAISLLNPLTRSEIQLPPMCKEFHSGYNADTNDVGILDINKVVLSEDPTSDNYVAMAICGENQKLAYCRSRDDKWTLIGFNEEEGQENQHDAGYGDIIYHKGQLYGISWDGVVVVCNIMDTIPKATIIKAEVLSFEVIAERGRVNGQIEWDRSCLELSGELTTVARHVYSCPEYVGNEERFSIKTTSLSCWRLEPEYGKWEEVTNLGESTLFLGKNSSCSLPVSDTFGSCKPNSIYFIDEYKTSINGELEVHDLDIYDLKAETIAMLLCYPEKVHPTMELPPSSIWVTPSL